MKQVLQDLRSGQVIVEDVPVPEPGTGQVLVKVAASLVSAGTERMIYDFAQRSLLGKARSRPDLVRRALVKARIDGPLAAWQAANTRLDQPMPLGYSCAGTVTGCGPEVHEFKPGDRVACAGAGWANHAEFVTVPALLCARLEGGSISDEEAAFCTLGAISLQGLRLAGISIGDSVGVIGLGLVGQLSAQLARAAGCRVFATDIDPERVAIAARLGAGCSVVRGEAEQAAREFTAGSGVDVVIIAADSKSPDPINLAALIARDRGCVVSVGAVPLDVPRDPFYRKELTLRVSRSYGPGRYDPVYEVGGVDYPIGHVRWTEGRNLREVARQLSNGSLAVRPLMTHRFPIADARRAYEVISRSAHEPFLGVLLTYQEPVSAVTSVPSEPQPAPSATARGVSVVGSGLYATSTVLPILKRLRAPVRGIASASGASARSAAKRFGFAFAAAALPPLLSDAETGLAAILTRHDLHAEQILAALHAGKRVFVEKPLCLTPQELDRILSAAGEGPGRVTVGFNRRFAPLTRRLEAQLAGVRGPKAVQVRVTAGELPDDHWLLDPAIGGGRLLGEGCHFLDWACFIIGTPPASVSSRSFGRRAGEQDWGATVRFQDGSLAEIVYTALGDPAAGKERYEVHAAGFSAVLEDFRKLRVWRDGRETKDSHWLRADKGHQALWEAVLASLAEGSGDPVPLAQSALSMRVTFAALESLRGGGRVVDL